MSIGWAVLARNVKNKYGELDIAAFDAKSQPKELVIVEVRARTIGKTQSPVDSIGPRKLHTLIRAGREFVDSLDWQGFWRFDLIGITFHNANDPNDWTLEHIRDITAGMNPLS